MEMKRTIGQLADWINRQPGLSDATCETWYDEIGNATVLMASYKDHGERRRHNTRRVGGNYTDDPSHLVKTMKQIINPHA